MKSRKLRSVRIESIKRKVPSDVSPSTSLPPLVEGQLRCFLRVTISRLLWAIHKPPSPVFIRLRWWGESSNGTHFFPRDGSQPSQKTIKTTARFPIRCGPKQFTSYLTDMGSLVLEVLTKTDHLPVARAQVAGISSLTLSQPISGSYTLVSPTSDKMGELHVSLTIEPLTEAYDSSGSAPVIDISHEGRHVKTPNVPSQHTQLTSGSDKTSGGNSGGNTPRGRDHLFFQTAEKDFPETLENQTPKYKESAVSNEESSHRQTSNDVLSVILQRGNKLRDAMVVSAFKCEMDPSPALKDTPLPLPRDNIQPSSKLCVSHPAKFLENILQDDSELKSSELVALVSDCGRECPSSIDDVAVDLLLSSSHQTILQARDGRLSPLELLSGQSSLCADSELNDPQYDQSLLEKLFYKNPILDRAPADIIEEDGQGKISSVQKQQSGPKMSEVTNPVHLNPMHDCDRLSLLSEEQLALLSSTRLFKVTINSLTVPKVSSAITHKKTSSNGKCLRPLMSKKCTYFVEYTAPMSLRSKTGSHEVTRVASSKITEGAVDFHQSSFFPVHFSTATVQHWLKTDLLFKIFSRKSNQIKASAIGTAVYPLRCLLQSKQLIQSIVLPIQSLEHDIQTQGIGPLKVTLELAADSKSLSEKSKNKLSWKDAPNTQTAPSPDPNLSFRSQPTNKDKFNHLHIENTRTTVRTPENPLKVAHPHPVLHTSPPELEIAEVLLHALLMVPDGKNFNCGPLQAPNIYLNCKLFWCDETARSVVSWGQKSPTFNFVQVTPVALTNRLLERMKNNVMVIEVWQKTRVSGQDQLLGLVKLPLHQFYMSFRDPRITQLLLQAQYPVLGVDCYMPVIDVFSGTCKGNLRVVLAMGQSEQIVSLQRSRDKEWDAFPHLVRPVHLLDHKCHSHTQGIKTQVEPLREHLFVIKVEKVSGLMPLQSTVWGEADCYVQYTFPCQDQQAATEEDLNLIESSVNLRSFRTTTTLCVPDPVFGHTETHVLLAPEGVPVQRLLLSSLSSQGLSNGGGIQFEVWCRYYYPNVRDQLVARGCLPLSKLCAMVTMQRQHPNEAQMFSLPLIPRTDDCTGHQPQPSGLLDVCITYKHRHVRTGRQAGLGVASRLVTLVIQVHRACGLKAAARVLSQQVEGFSYFLSVGLNPFVSFQLSFLPDSERRCTRTSARTFCPEFDHHTELSCDLLAQGSSGETCSLAEQLEQASAIFTVWNRDNRKAMDFSKPKDLTLGTVKIPLVDLIHKKTGISGWFGISSTEETISSQHQHLTVGGLEISISFSHHSDRERVIKAAQGLAWEDTTGLEDGESWEHDKKKLSVTLSMPRAWLPVHCLLLPGVNELQRSTYCYLRCRFYDQEAFCSQMKHPRVEDGKGEQATVGFEGSQTVELRSSLPLLWYLREEKLEVQVWVAFKKDKTTRPSDKDRLLGSAFIDLSSLSQTAQQKQTLTGVYPLFRRSAADLQGAALRVHISLTSASDATEVSVKADAQMDSDSQEDLLPDVEEADQPFISVTAPTTSHPPEHSEGTPRVSPDITTAVQRSETGLEECFPVTVTVDRAMHLNLKGCPLAERNEGSPCCRVSYITADSAEPVSTDVITNTDCPIWDHQHLCWFSKQLLVEAREFLVFKVWHKGEMEQVIGFASVDLSPLLCGFPSVCGWYNITDLNGQCHGQLKVSITPLKGIEGLRALRKTVNEEVPKDSPSVPITYQTSATYSSFPAHISRYPEQKISSPDCTDRLFSERSSESSRHCEHMDGVRLYHQSLQEQTTSHPADINPSSSFLVSTLRKKLGELDDIQRYFSQKLSVPVFPSRPQHDVCSKQGEHRDSESEASQLLLKSIPLVREVNDINGLRRSQLETILPTMQSCSTSSSAGKNNHQTITEDDCSANNDLDCHPNIAFLPDSSPQEISEEPTDSEPEERDENKSREVIHDIHEGKQSCEVSETEEESEGNSEKDMQEEIDDDDDNEDYVEVLVKPRPLNEVTSLTDKTSPWTSVLSDPDLTSLESLEAADVSALSADESERTEMDKREKCIHGNPREEDQWIHSLNQSDTESEEVKKPRTSDRSQDKEPKSPLSTTTHATDTHNAPGPPGNLNTNLQCTVMDPVEVPNFFLPSHQLEASMRAIRLAPSFSQTLVNPGCSSSGHSDRPQRGRRRHPDMSPSSMKKETERIAKIFAAHFDETH
ncbi:C2 domain-containing protein 3 isoform X2 [Gouania willdenowi]|uniref:C2 domain-containing protein n=1 Tax=Gouania willdenowi TaxID=441366 RepID=A0A8C5N7Z5_GOUWI|nr:C2 domain-containing protein 3 isoform X2 [Gouania willdenowi]